MICLCGCGEHLPEGARPNRKYVDGAHRLRSFRLLRVAGSPGLIARLRARVALLTILLREAKIPIPPEEP